MTERMRQRPRDEDAANGQAAPEGAEGLGAARAEMDRLFAVASRNFEAMRQGESQEFLRRSRQTGGQ